jgi:phosphatidylserine/phosphatidylglycerophosphate/cardiolipin synthase-like enzyme
MTLTIQPGAGIAPVLQAIKKARKSVDIVIFRLDLTEVVDALAAAVARGLAVRALVAHTNRGGEKTLRKLEMRMLETGVTVSRSSEEVVRYHGKMMIIDGRVLHVHGFNCTRLDVDKSRSFGIATTRRKLVQEATKLFQLDRDRQTYTSSCEHLVVSPENSRARLAEFIKGAKRQLLIYDPEASDPRMLRLIADRVKAGVDVRIIGKTSSSSPVPAEKYPGKRLHVRAIIRDGIRAFVGSQSLRTLELDRRREVGVIVSDKKVVRQMADVFEADWARTPTGLQSVNADLVDVPA